MSSAWRGWPPKRSDLRVQGIQDVRLRDGWVKDGGHRSQLPRCRNKMGWKGRIVPPRVASGGRSIFYVRLAMSHTLGDFPATKASTGALAVWHTLADSNIEGTVDPPSVSMAWCTRRRQIRRSTMS